MDCCRQSTTHGHVIAWRCVWVFACRLIERFGDMLGGRKNKKWMVEVVVVLVK